MILVLGILGLVTWWLCIPASLICGIAAWVMGNSDLREMDAGRTDPTGRGMVQAGRIIGIIATALACLSIIVGVAIMVMVMVLGLGFAAAGAAAGVVL